MMHLTVCYYHVTYEFESEFTLYSLPECREVLARSRCHICSLNDSNGIRTQNPQKPVAVTVASDMTPASSKRFLDIQANYRVQIHSETCARHENAAVAITGAIGGTSSELFQELGLETLKSIRWLRKICQFYKIIKEKSPADLFELIPENSTPYTTRFVQKSQIPFLKTKTNFFKKKFFSAVIMDWNKIDVNIHNLASCNAFKRFILKFT